MSVLFSLSFYNGLTQQSPSWPRQGIAFDSCHDVTEVLLGDESPYPEVRSAVANTDDPTMHLSTFYAWDLGLVWPVFIPSVNQFFYVRYLLPEISRVP